MHCFHMRIVYTYITRVVKEQKGILVLSKVQFILSHVTGCNVHIEKLS